MSGSGICWAICKSAPHPRQPRQHPTSFLQAGCAFLPPNQQRQSTEGNTLKCLTAANVCDCHRVGERYNGVGGRPVCWTGNHSSSCTTASCTINRNKLGTSTAIFEPVMLECGRMLEALRPKCWPILIISDTWGGLPIACRLHPPHLHLTQIYVQHKCCVSCVCFGSVQCYKVLNTGSIFKLNSWNKIWLNCNSVTILT